MQANPTKVCTKCHVELPATSECFRPRKKGQIALKSLCRNCERLYTSKYRQQNPDKVKFAQKRWYSKNEEYNRLRRAKRYIEHGENDRAVHKKWCEDHRDHLLEYDRKRYAENKEYFAEMARRWRAQNHEQARAIRQAYRARTINALGSHTAEDIAQMYEDQEGLCAYCETPLLGSYHVDHIIPLIRGGSNDPDNLAITCPPCNNRKHDKPLLVFLELAVMEECY